MKCLGAPLILSCEFVHRVLRILLQLGQIFHSFLGVPRSWVHLSQLVSAVHSIRGLSAQVVLTSIPVLSVELRTPLKAVIFVPQAEPPLQNQQHVCPLPTPIKIDRLLPLLQGYVVNVVLMLFEGFTYGFPLHFEGGHTSFCSKNFGKFSSPPHKFSFPSRLPLPHFSSYDTRYQRFLYKYCAFFNTPPFLCYA